MPTVMIACDGNCGATRQGKPGVSATELRALLRTVGWTTDVTGVRAHIADFCPTCTAKAKGEI